MSNSTIFITYNPNHGDEETLAIRLHTIGTANGFRMFLPDRFNSTSVLDVATTGRIDAADYFILFSLSSKLSPIVNEEINYAWQRFKDKSKIIVIYHAHGAKSLTPQASANCTEIYFNPHQEHMDAVIGRIVKAIFQKEIKEKQGKDLQDALLALLAIGLGLLALNELTKK